MTVLTLPDAAGNDGSPPRAIRSGVPSSIRLRRAPRLEPPFDDERADTGAAPGAELPLDWSPPSHRGRGATGGAGRLGGSAGAVPAARSGLGAARDSSGSGAMSGGAGGPGAVSGGSPAGGSMPAGLPDALGSAERYVRLCLEVLNGFRPAAHLRTLTGPVEFADVVTQLNRRRNARSHHLPDDAGPRSGPANRGRGFGAANQSRGFGQANQGHAAATRFAPASLPSMVAPVPVRRNTAAPAHPFRLLKLRLSEPLDGIAEVVAVLSHGGASLAMAMRLERRAGQWLCALVQVV